MTAAKGHERVRVALIGFGYWGPNYARVLNELADAELRLVCDRSADRLAIVTQRYPAVETCTDVSAVFGRDDIDAVVIATPASTHHTLAVRALEAALHVLVEKPMSLDVAGAEDAAAVAARAGRVFMVGYTFLYNGGIRKMKECMGDGFGRTYYLHATRTNLGPIRQDVNAMWDLAPHDVAIFNYLLDRQPLWASAVGTRVLRSDRDDVVFATLGYGDGIVGNIHVSWADPNKVREVVAVGSHRRVVFNDLSDLERVKYYERGVSVGEAVADSFGEFKLLVRDGDIVSPRIEPREPLKDQCADFFTAIRTGRPPVANSAFSLGVIKTLVAVEASMRQSGAAVNV